jgi:lysine 2,3-aminomutase
MKFRFPQAPKPDSISIENWGSWAWQLRSSLKNETDFKKYFQLTAQEETAFRQGALAGKEIFNIRTTPYYASLCTTDPMDPLRRILMPHESEFGEGSQALLDPLGERKNKSAPRLIHRYPDRVLFLVTDICSVYCRYCTRKHFTGQDQAMIRPNEMSEALNYIRTHPGIREVILSGGDPLTLSNSQLRKILIELRQIDHIEIIRIGTRMPVVCPMRVDQELAQLLREFAPIYVMTHFNHPRELTAEAAHALTLLVDHGNPVMNQMVLLNGVNNHPAIVQALSRRLLYLRVKPYYMFQCDPSLGSDHLRTSIEDSLEIQKELWGVLSGLAMPNLSVDIPDGGGKTGYTPNFEVRATSEEREYIGWDGVRAVYKNPPPAQSLKPIDAHLYSEEWEQTKKAKEITLSLDEHTLPQTF